MYSGRSDEARHALHALCEDSTLDRDAQSDAILLTGLAGLREEGERLIAQHLERFGVRPEIDEKRLDELVAERMAYAAAQARGEPRVHARVSLWKRGMPGRYLPCEPGRLREVVIDDAGFAIRRCLRRKAYLWSEVTDARLERQQSYATYGRSRFTYVRRRLRLSVPDGEVLIDVSDVLPEFSRPDLLEGDVRSHVTVRDSAIRPLARPAERKRMLVTSVAVLVLLLCLFVGVDVLI